MTEVEITNSTSATWSDAANRKAVMSAWQQEKKDGKQVPLTTWLKGKPAITVDGITYKAPSYQTMQRWDEYKAVAGGVDAVRLPAGAALNVASILAESKRQLTEGRKELEKRKAALLAQVEEIDLDVMQIDEALAKLG